METIIKYLVEKELATLIYYIFHALGFIAIFAFVLWYGKKIQLTKLQSVLIILIVYPIAYVWMFIQYWISTGFQQFGGNNIVRTFIYVPLIGLIATKILKIEWKKVCHLLAYCPLLIQGTSHYGCIFFSCCEGYPSSWGIYNATKDTVCFPIQPIEATTAILIALFLLLRYKRRNYVLDGLAYPIMLILFGSTRFIWEFFRNNEKILWGCSELAFHALFMCIVGIVAFVIIYRRNKLKLQSKN